MKVIDLSSVRDACSRSPSCARHRTERSAGEGSAGAPRGMDPETSWCWPVGPGWMPDGAREASETLRLGEMRAPRCTSYPTADRFVEAFDFVEGGERSIEVDPRTVDPAKRERVAAERLEAAGYVYIGMDHFALPDDERGLRDRERAIDAGRLPTLRGLELDAERGRRTALRSIAAEFDRHLRARRDRGAFSRVL